jgi:hypothetical protein
MLHGVGKIEDPAMHLPGPTQSTTVSFQDSLDFLVQADHEVAAICSIRKHMTAHKDGAVCKVGMNVTEF